MGSIVCATRGGEGSRAVQLAAIEQARQLGKDLVFLFVADAAFEEQVEAHLRTAVHKEMLWMGNVLLQIAKQRAGARHIDVRLEIRTGPVKEAIEQFLLESRADLLLLGAPRGTTTTVFGDDAIEQFAHTVEEDTGVSVKVVRPEKVS